MSGILHASRCGMQRKLTRARAHTHTHKLVQVWCSLGVVRMWCGVGGVGVVDVVSWCDE